MKDVKEFLVGKFQTDCSVITLTKNEPESFTISGPGQIFQDPDGNLQFKVFAPVDEWHKLLDYKNRPSTPGQLVPDEDYFSFRAASYTLPIWNSDRVLPETPGLFAQGFIAGYLRELVHESPLPRSSKSDYLLLRLPAETKLPWNRQVSSEVRVHDRKLREGHSVAAAQTRHEGYQFEAYRDDDQVVATAELPAGELTNATPRHFRDALQFMQGEQLPMAVVETMTASVHTTRMLPMQHRKANMYPPLHALPNRHDACWTMFCRYFSYVHKNTPTQRHPISCHFASVLASMGAPLETQILSMAVAVEGIAGECFADLAPVDRKLLEELDAISTALQDLPLSETTTNRVKGTLGAMRSPRNSDILRAFIAHFGLPNGLYDSWSRLRNASAHGSGTGDRELETTLRMLNEVRMLLYSLTFAAIGYGGPRTDYCRPGFPETNWPPTME